MNAPLSYGLCLCGLLWAGISPALEEPPLSITNATSGFMVSWPELAPGWFLEGATHLNPPVPWTRISSDLYQTNAGLRRFSVPEGDGNRYFRLRKLFTGTSGLNGYWQLDEGVGDAAGEGAGSGPALLLTNTTWAPGRFGAGALQFNGAPPGSGGSRAGVGNDGYRVLPPPGQPFSVSLWFNPDSSTPGWRGLVGNDVKGTNGWHVVLHNVGPGTNDLIFGSPGDANSLSITGRTLLLPGKWRQLTVTHDGSVGALYLDGELLARGPGNVRAQEGPLYFGGYVPYDSFLGRIDEIRVYTNCLAAEEISLTGHWKFDEGGGMYSVDLGTRGRAARVVPAEAWAGGRDGAGIELSAGKVVIGNEDYGVLPPSGGAFSLSFWLRAHSLPLGKSGLMNFGTGTSSGWQLELSKDASGQSLRFCSTNHGGTLDLSAPLVMDNGTWTRIDVTYNGGIATLYVDGRQRQSAHGAVRGSTAPLVIGEVPGMENFDGTVDDLKIYNRERGAAEIGPVASAMWETAFLNGPTNFVLKGSGPAGKTLTYSIVPVVVPTNGEVSLAPGSGSVTYVAGGTKGPDAFAYTVSDGDFTTPPAIVSVSVVKPHWLSPTGGVDGQDGWEPDRAWVAGGADAMDAILKTNQYYDCFLYAPGLYETRGFYHGIRSTANPGCKHIGSGATGPDRTTIRMVDVWEAGPEGTVFANAGACDDFELRNLEIDCNAANAPQQVRGEPIWIKIPLATTTRVESVTLRWENRPVPASPTLRLGRAVEFSVCARRDSTNTFITNCVNGFGTGLVEVVTVGAEADELILQMDRRDAGVDFYGVREIEVAGGVVSLPSATSPGGAPSRFDLSHSILAAVDGAPDSFWVSGAGSEVEMVLPLARGSTVSQVNLQWNCKTLPGVGRLGPAADYFIRAREEATGLYYDVPFVRHGRRADGQEAATFGTALLTNAIVTDQVVLVLTNREPQVNYYSLREVTLQHGADPVAMRLPTARSILSWGVNHTALRAFDTDLETQWACGTQGELGAVNIYGSNLKLTSLRIIGFGTKGGRECFPMFVSSSGKTDHPVRWGNVLIEDCVFTEPAPNNRDGMTALVLAAQGPSTLTNAIVRRCTVKGVKSYFSYSQAMAAVHVEDCLVEDCGVGVYFEPDAASQDSVGPVMIRSNRFINVNSGVYLLSHAGSRFDSITCIGNEMVLTGAGGWGFGVCDVCDPGPSGMITNVTVLNNIVRYPGWSKRSGNSDGGFYHTDIHHSVMGNNLVALGTPNQLRVRFCPAGIIPGAASTADCDNPVPLPPGPATYPPCLDMLPVGYQRAWFNNCDLSGNLIDVRYSNQGVDRPASQQQWPD